MSIKTLRELKTITTKNLLALYRAERKRMYRKGYHYVIIDEEDNGEPMYGWDIRNNLIESTIKQLKNLNEAREYISQIKKELETRENVNKL